MEIYLVGGAVRDQLLGLAVQEKDWVVIGASPEEMLALGYQPVGKDFPVFLHPKTHEEYALARTERKSGKGYKGFTFHTDTSVTLEEDLVRRDLTINAIAQSNDGALVDPYNGQADIKNKILRHVSPAFQEDPVRILRLARFSSYFPDFSIDPATLTLANNMVNDGEVDALVPERVWQELAKTLRSQRPSQFFHTLNQCGALSVLFPALSIEGSGIKTLSAIENSIGSPTIRLAIALHTLTETEAKTLIERYRIPNDYSQLCLLLIKHGSAYTTLNKATPDQWLNFLLVTDALRRPERFNDFISACKCCFPDTDINSSLFSRAIVALKTIDVQTLLDRDLKGKDFMLALRELRINALHKFLG